MVSQYSGHQRRILLYDPGEAADSPLSEYLSGEGYHVDSAATEADVMQLVEQRHYALLILRFETQRALSWPLIESFVRKFPRGTNKVLRSYAADHLAKLMPKDLTARLQEYNTTWVPKASDLSVLSALIRFRIQGRPHNAALSIQEGEPSRRSVDLPGLVKRLEPEIRDVDIPWRLDELRDLLRGTFLSHSVVHLLQCKWVMKRRLAVLVRLDGARDRHDWRLVILRRTVPGPAANANSLEEIPEALAHRECNTTNHYDLCAYELKHADDPARLVPLEETLGVGRKGEAEASIARTFDEILNPWEDRHTPTAGHAVDEMLLERLSLGRADQLLQNLPAKVQHLSNQLGSRGVRLIRSDGKISIQTSDGKARLSDPLELLPQMLSWKLEVWPTSVPGHASLASILVYDHRKRTQNKKLSEKENYVWLTDPEGQGPAPRFWSAACLESELRFGQGLFEPHRLHAYVRFQERLSTGVPMPDPQSVAAKFRGALSLVKSVRKAARIRSIDALKYLQVNVAYLALAKLHEIEPTMPMSDTQALASFQALLVLATLLQGLRARSLLPQRQAQARSEMKRSATPAVIVCLENSQRFAAGETEFTLQGDLAPKLLRFFVQNDGQFVSYADINRAVGIDHSASIAWPKLTNNIQRKVSLLRARLAELCPEWSYFESIYGGSHDGGYIFSNPPTRRMPAPKSSTSTRTRRR